MSATMDKTSLQRFVDETWSETIVPTLSDDIRIPNRSPAFDPEWAQHGHMDEAVALIERWCAGRAIPGLTVEVIRLPDRTPLVYMEIPAAAPSRDTVLLYGHLDKQPEMTGWETGLGPWTPVQKGDRLYGRGGADDGTGRSRRSRLPRRSRVAPMHARCVVWDRSGRRAAAPIAGASSIRRRIGDEPGDLPGLRVRQLRAALGDDVAARDRQRRAHRRGAQRGDALRGGERHRAVEPACCGRC
jgi:hypothetical protein